MSIPNARYPIVDAALVRRAQARDLDAFEQIYRLTYSALMNTLWRLLGSESDAQDIAHDSYVLAFERLHQLNENAPMWPWLKQIGIHLSLSKLRQGARLDVVAELDESALGTVEIDFMPDSQALQNALATLPKMARAVLWLYEVECYTHEEIALEMRRSVSFSKSQLARARAKLKATLSPQLEPLPCPV
jgi:RNA polymerase sigma factor (sigma-70 family)